MYGDRNSIAPGTINMRGVMTLAALINATAMGLNAASISLFSILRLNGRGIDRAWPSQRGRSSATIRFARDPILPRDAIPVSSSAITEPLSRRELEHRVASANCSLSIDKLSRHVLAGSRRCCFYNGFHSQRLSFIGWHSTRKLSFTISTTLRSDCFYIYLAFIVSSEMEKQFGQNVFFTRRLIYR